MSSAWEPADSGDSQWTTQDDPGLQQADGDAWSSNPPPSNPPQGDSWSGDPLQGNGFGNDENENPFAGSGGNDNACHRCGSLDHFARECPNAPPRGCFNCGEEGHNKADCPHPPRCGNCGKEDHMRAECPEPQVVKGPCRYCNKEGHHVANCPTKPATICKNCKGEGHMAKNCKENRQFDKSGIPDMTPEDAWAKMKQANDDRDLDDFREAFSIYTKAVPEATFIDIEKKMREENFGIFTIAMEKQAFDVYSLIDLQGQVDREYVVGFYFSAKAPRKALENRWPDSPENNLERLANAGFPHDRGVPKCRNCGEMGHIAARCKEEKVEHDTVQIKCANCGEIGHRVRDCKEERRNKFGCRNCGSNDHQAKDCPEPPSAADVECRKCGETGHFAKDCPQGGGGQGGGGGCHNCGSEYHFARDCDQPRNPSTMVCRNCDQPGHAARECPEPKNWSKVQCNQCGEFGHTVRRCPQSGGEFGSGEAGTGGFGGNESGDAPAPWEDTQTGQNEQSDWNGGGQVMDNTPFEQELSDKLAQVSWDSNADTQEPQYGW